MKAMQSLIADINRGVQTVEEKYQFSQAYRDNCAHFSAERDHLMNIGTRLLSEIDRLKIAIDAAVVYTEYASGCKYMHRGYYCPSLIQDAVICNTRRGKLLKKLTARSKTYWEYGFNGDGQLIRCENLLTIKRADRECLTVGTREFLIYENGCRYGITLRSDNSVEAITEEVFQNERCVQYTHMLCTSFNGVLESVEISSEHYTYDGSKMYAQWHHICFPSEHTPEFLEKTGVKLASIPIYRCDRYSFEQNEDRFILADNN